MSFRLRAPPAARRGHSRHSSIQLLRCSWRLISDGGTRWTSLVNLVVSLCLFLRNISFILHLFFHRCRLKMGGATLELFSTNCMELSALWFLGLRFMFPTVPSTPALEAGSSNVNSLSVLISSLSVQHQRKGVDAAGPAEISRCCAKVLSSSKVQDNPNMLVSAKNFYIYLSGMLAHTTMQKKT